MQEERTEPVGSVGFARDVARLLQMYERALEDAACLPLILAPVPCRPSRWRLLRPVSRVPRMTLGTRMLVVRHVARSLRAPAPAQAGKPRRGHPFLTTVAFASFLATPVVVCSRLWRLAGPAGRRQLRLLAAASCPVLLVLTWAPLGWDSPAADYGCWTAAGFLYAFLLAAYQQCQNDLVRSLGVQLPYGRCETARSATSRTRKQKTES
ncbi:hypothetical protein [Streptomyces sp. NPDC049585]|uniref:hypothetical protein n=1 Tax=Streptomyces sp. NPDC049585 TaxID=3155154 RepID=UPI0034404B2A